MSYYALSTRESLLSSLPGCGIPVTKNTIDFNKSVNLQIARNVIPINQVIPGIQRLVGMGLAQNIQWIVGCVVDRKRKGLYDPIFVCGTHQEQDYTPLHTARRVSKEELEYEVSSFAHRCILYPYLHKKGNTMVLYMSLTFLVVDHYGPESSLKKMPLSAEAQQIYTGISDQIRYIHQFEVRPGQQKLRFEGILANFVQQF